MTQGKWSRRAFIGHSAVALGASSMPLDLLAQTTLKVRPEWQAFKTTARYASLLRAISLMKANTNAADPGSWSYWTNIHVSNCPHSVAYFLAWHRGYLYHFERRLRAVSGDSQLVLPYWDYYAHPTIPAEFTNSSSANPLYVDRVNTNVQPVLTMAPFGPTLTNFQRGMSNAFETSIEDAPHNPVHDLIGGVMATMESPVDPIFWLHHANIDRLWVAWVSAAGGRTMPGTSSPYWSGAHAYTSSLSIPRAATHGTRSTLGYRYYNEKMPLMLPRSKTASPAARPASSELAARIPAPGAFRQSGPRQSGPTTFSLGGAENLTLDEGSVTVSVPTSAEHARTLQEIGAGKSGKIPGRPDIYRSVLITLDHVTLTELGKRGGYFYQLYLNIPAKGGSGKPRNILIGTLGAFKINSAAHHEGGRVKLHYPIRRALRGAMSEELGALSLSFFRVSGEQSPRGAVIGMGEVRLELSTEDVE